MHQIPLRRHTGERSRGLRGSSAVRNGSLASAPVSPPYAPCLGGRDLPSASAESIALDDWRRSVTELGPKAVAVLDQRGQEIASKFLSYPAAPYTPFPIESRPI